MTDLQQSTHFERRMNGAIVATAAVGRCGSPPAIRVVGSYESVARL
jgi:hypothetical protein